MTNHSKISRHQNVLRISATLTLLLLVFSSVGRSQSTATQEVTTDPYFSTKLNSGNESKQKTGAETKPAADSKPETARLDPIRSPERNQLRPLGSQSPQSSSITGSRLKPLTDSAAQESLPNIIMDNSFQPASGSGTPGESGKPPAQFAPGSKSIPKLAGDQAGSLDSNTIVVAEQHDPQRTGVAAPTAFENGQVVAMVGGEPIFVGDIMFEANQLIQKFMPGAPRAVQQKQLPEVIRKLVPKYVEQKLLYIDTVQGLPDNADVDAILEQADGDFDEKALKPMMKNSGVKSPTEFDAQLRAMGSSLRSLRRSWSKDQLVRFFLSKQLSVDSEVTHRELLDYYNEHIDDYQRPARARWEQLMVRFDRFPSQDEARAEIVNLGNQVVYGAPLDAVAKKHSHGFRAQEGGQHDWTTKGALVSGELDQAIFTLPLHELSEIIETGNGFHVVRVIEREDAGRTPFLEAQVEIKKQLEMEKRQAAFSSHMEKLRKRIPVEVYVPGVELVSQ